VTDVAGARKRVLMEARKGTKPGGRCCMNCPRCGVSKHLTRKSWYVADQTGSQLITNLCRDCWHLHNARVCCSCFLVKPMNSSYFYPIPGSASDFESKCRTCVAPAERSFKCRHCKVVKQLKLANWYPSRTKGSPHQFVTSKCRACSAPENAHQRICAACLEPKALNGNNFWRDPQERMGYRDTCKVCMRSEQADLAAARCKLCGEDKPHTLAYWFGLGGGELDLRACRDCSNTKLKRRVCSQCFQDKELDNDNFWRCSTKAGGLEARCKDCMQARLKTRRARHRDARMAAMLPASDSAGNIPASSLIRKVEKGSHN